MTNIGEPEPHMIDLLRYRRLIQQFIDMRRYKTALFWTEKVCVLSDYKTEDVYMLAQCFFLLKEYHRAAFTIRLHALEKIHIPSYSLLLESLYEAKQFEEALNVINSLDIEFLTNSMLNSHLDGGDDASMIGVNAPKKEAVASIMYVKGKIFEAMDNRGLAMDYYVQALHKSIYCYEALDALVSHDMLMAWEEKELLQHLPLVQQSSDNDAKLISRLYQSKLKKYNEPLMPISEKEKCPIAKNVKAIREIKEMVRKNLLDGYLHKEALPNILAKSKNTQYTTPTNKLIKDDFKDASFSLHMSLSRVSSTINDSSRSMETPVSCKRSKKTADVQVLLPLELCLKRVRGSTDIMASEAERLFYQCDFKKAMKILEKLFKIDPYHEAGMTVQIGCLVEFGDFNKLFYTAHKLVDRYPDKALSWYAVGCYYDLIGKSDPARRYLSKATSLDRLYGPAWLAYGHSFAKENEHDQAMAAYFKATQLMRGCHLPLLYIGVECGLTKNLVLAERFFYQSMSVAPLDVFVMHELGVIKYEYEFYENAEEVFRVTVDVIKHRAKMNKEEVAPRWEPLFNNFGHCLRKNKKYSEAVENHQLALLLKPQSYATYTNIGFALALQGNLEGAVTYFHKSLALNRDCIVTTTILKTCIEDLMNQNSVVSEILDKSPLPANNSVKCSRKTGSKRLPAIDESPPNYASMKSNKTNDHICTQTETHFSMDISMDTQ